MRNILHISCVIVFSLSIAACDFFAANEKEFEWLVDGYTTHYNFESNGDSLVNVDGVLLATAENAMTIAVLPISPGSILITIRDIRSLPDSVDHSFFYLIGVKSVHGIVGYKAGNCPPSLDKCLFPTGDAEPITRVPSNPRKDQIFIQPDRSSYWVEWTNRNVEVPAGNFRSFSLLNKKHKRREIWSVNHGLIALEVLDDNWAAIGTFLLSSIETAS